MILTMPIPFPRGDGGVRQLLKVVKEILQPSNNALVNYTLTEIVDKWEIVE